MPGNENKKKILYLYGYGNSIDLSELQLREMKKYFPDYEFEVLQGSVKLCNDEHWAVMEAGAAGESGHKLVEIGKEGYMDLFTYWEIHLTGEKDFQGNADYFGKPEDIEKAGDHLVAHIIEKGGYDGIMGFSQGGELVNILLERTDALPDHIKDRLKFVATFSSDDVFLRLKREPKGRILKPGIKYFLCAGQKANEKGPLDKEAIDACTTLKSHWKDDAVIHVELWEGEHSLPDEKNGHVYQKMYQFIQ